MNLLGIVLKSFYRSSFSVVSGLVRLLTRWPNEAVILLMKSRSSKARHQKQLVPRRKRAFALAAVRHQKSLYLISAQEKTQSDVDGQENPGQVSVTDCTSQVPPESQKSESQERWRLSSNGREPQENLWKIGFDEGPNQHCNVVYLRTRLHLGIIPNEPQS